MSDLGTFGVDGIDDVDAPEAALLESPSPRTVAAFGARFSPFLAIFRRVIDYCYFRAIEVPVGSATESCEQCCIL